MFCYFLYIIRKVIVNFHFLIILELDALLHCNQYFYNMENQKKAADIGYSKSDEVW